MISIGAFYKKIFPDDDSLESGGEEDVDVIEQEVRQLAEDIGLGQLNDEEMGQLSELVSHFQRLNASNEKFAGISDKISQIFQEVTTPTDESSMEEEETRERLAYLLSQEAPRPAKSNKADQDLLNAWVERHPADLKPAIRALAAGLRHIGQAEFEAALKRVIVRFNDRLQELGGESFAYYAGVEEYKSNLWVAQLAYAADELQIKPVGAIPLAYGEIFTSGQIEQNPPPKAVALFDDAVYSGEQMSRIVSGMMKEGVRQGFPLEKIFIICPYMTHAGKAKVEAIPPEGECKIEIFLHENIPTISDVIGNPTFVKTLGQMYGKSKQSAFAKEEILTTNSNVIAGLGVVYFDHKVPDDRSFPAAIVEGKVKNRSRATIAKVPHPLQKTPSPYNSGAEEYDEEENLEEDRSSISSKSLFSESSTFSLLEEDEEGIE